MCRCGTPRNEVLRMIETGAQLASAAKRAALEYKTLYVLGCFGAPMNQENKDRYTKNLPYNGRNDRKQKILAADGETFGFDCVCFVKGLLWGWEGNAGHCYGGAQYQSRSVPDKNADSVMKLCLDASDDFSYIQEGEYLWISGHCGIYIGGGLAVECTHRWADGVQVTAVHNLVADDGTPGRRWTKHGKLPWVTYAENGFSLSMTSMGRGDRGEHVRALQILLSGRGFNGRMHTPDGIFGPNTEGAVKLFQSARGLQPDGIAGEKTIRSLLGVK